jgi:hypothetical protein
MVSFSTGSCPDALRALCHRRCVGGTHAFEACTSDGDCVNARCEDCDAAVVLQVVPSQPFSILPKGFLAGCSFDTSVQYTGNFTIPYESSVTDTTGQRSRHGGVGGITVNGFNSSLVRQ